MTMSKKNSPSKNQSFTETEDSQNAINEIQNSSETIRLILSSEMQYQTLLTQLVVEESKTKDSLVKEVN